MNVLGDHNYHVLQDTLITFCQVTLKKQLLCKAFEDSRPPSPKHQRLWLCFTRQQTKAKNPDYVGRPAKAGFGEKLKKAIQYVLVKELGTTSSIPRPAL